MSVEHGVNYCALNDFVRLVLLGLILGWLSFGLAEFGGLILGRPHFGLAEFLGWPHFGLAEFCLASFWVGLILGWLSFGSGNLLLSLKISSKVILLLKCFFGLCLVHTYCLGK